MGPTVFEGTWEEVAGHAAELAGRRVRLTILEDQSEAETLDRVLAPLLEAAGPLRREPSSDQAPPGPWAESIIEKFRRQGFRP